MVWSIFSEYVSGYSCSNLKFTQYRFQARVIFLVESEFSFYPQQPPAVWADPSFFKIGLPVLFSRDRLRCFSGLPAGLSKPLRT